MTPEVLQLKVEGDLILYPYNLHIVSCLAGNFQLVWFWYLRDGNTSVLKAVYSDRVKGLTEVYEDTNWKFIVVKVVYCEFN